MLILENLVSTKLLTVADTDDNLGFLRFLHTRIRVQWTCLH